MFSVSTNSPFCSGGQGLFSAIWGSISYPTNEKRKFIDQVMVVNYHCSDKAGNDTSAISVAIESGINMTESQV